MKTNKNIENLFRENLENYSEMPSDKVWKGISQEIKTKSFFNFSTNTFNVYYLLAVIFIVGTTFFFVGQTNKKLISNKNTVNKQTNTILPENKEINNTFKKETSTNNISENTVSNTQNIKQKKNFSIIKAKPIDTINVKYFESAMLNAIVDNNYIDEDINSETKRQSPQKELKANFSINNNEGCTPFTVNFNNKSIGGDTYFWDFGNGKTSTQQHPVATYDVAGLYTAILTIQSGDIISTFEQEIIVHEKPIAKFIVNSEDNIFKSQILDFANTSQNAYSYNWNFGDGENSTSAHPKHKFSKKGVYKVKLTVSSEFNCKSSVFSKEIFVKDSKYKIEAPTGFIANRNFKNSGFWERELQNSVFRIFLSSEPQSFSMRIYNRNGQIVFRTNNYRYGWNGYYRDRISSEDVYVWECSGTFNDGQPFYKTGNVTLIKGE